MSSARLLAITLHGLVQPGWLSRFMAVLAQAGEALHLRDLSSFTVGDRFTATLAVEVTPTRQRKRQVSESDRNATDAEAEPGSTSLGALAASQGDDRANAPGSTKALIEHEYGTEGYLLREILLTAYELGGIETEFEVLDAPEAGHAGALDDSSDTTDSYTFTFIGTPRIPAAFFATASRVLAENEINLNAIQSLSEPGSRSTCFQIVAALRNPLAHRVRSELFHLGKQHLVDIAFERTGALRTKRMVVFDLSWTLVQADGFDLLCQAAEVDSSALAKVRRRHALGSDEYLRACAALLCGRPIDGLARKLHARIEYTEGAVSVCRVLRKLGYRIAVLSSGPLMLAELVKADLGIDFVAANHLEIDGNGMFTGAIQEPVVNGERKAELLTMLAMREQLSTEQIIAVGDGPVSAKMLDSAGLSIAFEQPGARDEADMDGKIQSKSLTSILFLLGIRERDLRAFS
jgi:phosphoserine phosphatase